MFQIFGRNTDPGIFHHALNPFFIFGHPGPDSNMPFRGKLLGISDQIHKHLR